MSVVHDDSQTLYAYLDGELAPAERSAFEVRLAADPRLATLLSEEQHFRKMMKTRVASMKAPKSLRASVQNIPELTPEPSAWQRFLRWWSTPQLIRPRVGFAYTLLWVVLFGGTVLWMGQPGANATLPATSPVAQLLEKHQTYFEGSALLDITGPAPTITAWAKERVSEPVHIPSLGNGWQLAGARLDDLQQQRIVHLLYINENDQRMTLSTFLPQASFFPAQDKIQIANQDFFMTEDSLHRAILWQTNNIGYALIGNIGVSAEDFRQLAHSVRSELETGKYQ